MMQNIFSIKLSTNRPTALERVLRKTNQQFNERPTYSVQAVQLRVIKKQYCGNADAGDFCYRPRQISCFWSVVWKKHSLQWTVEAWTIWVAKTGKSYELWVDVCTYINDTSYFGMFFFGSRCIYWRQLRDMFHDLHLSAVGQIAQKVHHHCEPTYLRSLISLQTALNTRSYSVVTLARPTPFLKVTDHSFKTSPHPWNQFPAPLGEPVSPLHAALNTSFSSPLFRPSLLYSFTLNWNDTFSVKPFRQSSLTIDTPDISANGTVFHFYSTRHFLVFQPTLK